MILLFYMTKILILLFWNFLEKYAYYNYNRDLFIFEYNLYDNLILLQNFHIFNKVNVNLLKEMHFNFKN
jgi:hypothetical protein